MELMNSLKTQVSGRCFHDLVGRPHLRGTLIRWDLPDACTQATTYQRINLLLAQTLVVIVHRNQNSAKRKVGIDGKWNRFGDSHRRGCDQVSPSRVPCLDDLGTPYRQFPVVVCVDHLLNLLLDRKPELITDREIKAPIHDTETVGGANEGIRRSLEIVAGDGLDRW